MIDISHVLSFPIWLPLEAIGTVGAAVAAWFSIRKSNKQLELQQTPHVILDHIIKGGRIYSYGK